MIPSSQSKSFPLAQVTVAATLVLGMVATANAQRVFRDAVTGEFRPPTAAEVQQLEALNKALKARVPRGLLTGTPNPQPVRMPDGSDFLENTDADLNYSVVMRNRDGQLVRHCVPNAEIAERLVRGEVTSFTKPILERLNER
jgi:hypothetical protein